MSVVSHERVGECGEKSAGLVVGCVRVEPSIILLNNDDSSDDADLLVADE